MSMSVASATISVRRSSPNCLRISWSSSTMISRTSFSEPRISRSFAISARTSLNSATIFSRSRPVSRWRRMSRMACAWISSRRRTWLGLPPSSPSELPMNFSSAERVIEISAERRVRASCGSLDARMILITRSRFARASARPRRRWARSSAFFRSNCVRRMTTDLAVVDEVAEEVVEGQDARLVLDDREEDDPERRLHRGQGVELVEDDLGVLAALELHDDAHALAVGLVAQVRDAVDLLVVDELGDPLDELGLVDLVGDLA